jgi:hypothetical protein
MMFDYELLAIVFLSHISWSHGGNLTAEILYFGTDYNCTHKAYMVAYNGKGNGKVVPVLNYLSTTL